MSVRPLPLQHLSQLTFDLDFWTCIGHDRRLSAIESQGYRSRSRVRFRLSVS